MISSNENKISLHVFNFPHPTSSNRSLESKSIFYFVESNFTNFFTINNISDRKNFPTSVCEINDFSVAIGFENGQLIIIDLQSKSHMHKEHVIEDSSSLLRFFDYFKGESKNPILSMASEEVAVSRGRSIIYDNYLFAIFGDDVLRVYSVQKKMILMKLPLNLKTSQKEGKKKAIRILRRDESNFTLSIIVEDIKGTSCLVFDGKFETTGEVELIFSFTSQYFSQDFVDAQLSTQKGETLLWALWKGVDLNSHLLLTPASIRRKNVLDMNLWKECILATPNPRETVSLDDFDIDKKYLDIIFHPNRFNSEIIYQSLCWITNTKYSLNSSEMNYSNLRTLVQNEMNRLDDEDKWKVFLKKCETFWRRENDVIGLYRPKNKENLMFLIRKNGISIMRKGSYSEYISMILSGLSNQNLYTLKSIDNDYYYLLYTMSRLEKELGKVYNEEFNSRLYQLEDPYFCALDIVTKLTQSSRLENSLSLFFTHTLCPAMKNISDISNAIEFVFKHINPLYCSTKNANVKQYPLCKFYSSDVLRNIVSQSVIDIHKSNFEILRNLLFIIALVKVYRHLVSIDGHKIMSLAKDISKKVKYYFSTTWLFSQIVKPQSLEANQVLNKSKTELLNAENVVQIYYTLFQKNLVNIFEEENEIASYLHGVGALSSESNWESLLPFILSFSSLIYPETECYVDYDFIFAMIKQNHISLMQSYIRLIDSKSSYHQYLLGECYLRSSEYTKAIDCFTKSGIFYQEKPDRRIEELISKYTEGHKNAYTITDYWIYILSVINEYSNPDLILRMSKIFLSFSNSSIFWSNLFNSALKLGKYDIAYIALLSIPDMDVQRDCLSTFITDIVEVGYSKQLLNYPFIGLNEIVDQIILKKAQLTNSTIYYELLYALNINRSNYGKAATALYECSLKMKNESRYDDQMLRKRTNYLLATINVLKLLKPENAWILSRKNQSDKENQFEISSTSKQVENAEYELISLEKIEKMYNKLKEELKLRPSTKKIVT